MVLLLENINTTTGTKRTKKKNHTQTETKYSVLLAMKATQVLKDMPEICLLLIKIKFIALPPIPSLSIKHTDTHTHTHTLRQ